MCDQMHPFSFAFVLLFKIQCEFKYDLHFGHDIKLIHFELTCVFHLKALYASNVPSMDTYFLYFFFSFTKSKLKDFNSDSTKDESTLKSLSSFLCAV